jgi:hypothetical protein
MNADTQTFASLILGALQERQILAPMPAEPPPPAPAASAPAAARPSDSTGTY